MRVHILRLCLISYNIYKAIKYFSRPHSLRSLNIWLLFINKFHEGRFFFWFFSYLYLNIPLSFEPQCQTTVAICNWAVVVVAVSLAPALPVDGCGEAQIRSFWTPIYGHILIALAKHSSNTTIFSPPLQARFMVHRPGSRVQPLR